MEGNKSKNIKVELSEEEIKFISDCIYMSAKESFYGLLDSKVDEPYGFGANLVKKLGITDKGIINGIEKGF